MNTKPTIVVISTFQHLEAQFKGTTSDIWLEALYRIYAQLSEDPEKPMEKLTTDRFRHFFGWKGVLFLAVLDGQVVGMATLAPVPDIDSFGGYVDNVVVDRPYRGRGYSRLLMNELMARAQTRYMQWLELTSRSSRVEAHSLYLSLGFRQRDTLVFQFNFPSSGAA